MDFLIRRFASASWEEKSDKKQCNYVIIRIPRKGNEENLGSD